MNYEIERKYWKTFSLAVNFLEKFKRKQLSNLKILDLIYFEAIEVEKEFEEKFIIFKFQKSPLATLI